MRPPITALTQPERGRLRSSILSYPLVVFDAVALDGLAHSHHGDESADSVNEVTVALAYLGEEHSDGSHGRQLFPLLHFQVKGVARLYRFLRHVASVSAHDVYLVVVGGGGGGGGGGCRKGY